MSLKYLEKKKIYSVVFLNPLKNKLCLNFPIWKKKNYLMSFEKDLFFYKISLKKKFIKYTENNLNNIKQNRFKYVNLLKKKFKGNLKRPLNKKFMYWNKPRKMKRLRFKTSKLSFFESSYVRGNNYLIRREEFVLQKLYSWNKYAKLKYFLNKKINSFKFNKKNSFSSNKVLYYVLNKNRLGQQLDLKHKGLLCFNKRLNLKKKYLKNNVIGLFNLNKYFSIKNCIFNSRIGITKLLLSHREYLIRKFKLKLIPFKKEYKRKKKLAKSFFLFNFVRKYKKIKSLHKYNVYLFLLKQSFKFLFNLKKEKHLRNLVLKFKNTKKDSFSLFLNHMESQLLYFLRLYSVLPRYNNNRHKTFIRYYGWPINGRLVKDYKYKVKCNDIISLPLVFVKKQHKGVFLYSNYFYASKFEMNIKTYSSIKLHIKNLNYYKNKSHRFHKIKKIAMLKNLLNINF